MLQKQATGSSTGNLQSLPVHASDATVTFTALSAVRGIVFHLLDEKLARRVSDDTIQRTIQRLDARPFSPSIQRGRWLGMTNPQRLEWLLAQTQTITLVEANDTVLLRPRRTR
jgi:hypothetical protein